VHAANRRGAGATNRGACSSSWRASTRSLTAEHRCGFVPKRRPAIPVPPTNCKFAQLTRHRDAPEAARRRRRGRRGGSPDSSSSTTESWMRRARVLFPSRPSTRPGSGSSAGTRRAPRRAAPALLAVRGKKATEVVAVAKPVPRGTPRNPHQRRKAALPSCRNLRLPGGN